MSIEGISKKEFRKGARGHMVTWQKEDGTSSQSFLTISKYGFELTSGPRHAWSEVTKVETDGADALQTRVTATRFLTVGLFALALKKKTGEVYLYLRASGQDYLLQVGKVSAPEVNSWFGQYKSLMNLQADEPSTTAASAIQELESLAGLLERGLVTEEEFAKRKGELLGSNIPAVAAPPSLPPAGWYSDPHGDGLRYWNGAAWTEDRQSHPVPVDSERGQAHPI